MSEHKSRWPAWAREFSTEVHQHLARMEKHLVTDQDKLDADVQALNDGLTNIEAEIAALKNQPAAQGVDFTALDAAVARLKGDETPPTPTPDPTPTPAPTPDPTPAPDPNPAP